MLPVIRFVLRALAPTPSRLLYEIKVATIRRNAQLPRVLQPPFRPRRPSSPSLGVFVLTSRTAARLEGLSFGNVNGHGGYEGRGLGHGNGDGREEQSLQSPAKKHQGNQGNAPPVASASGVGVARR